MHSGFNWQCEFEAHYKLHSGTFTSTIYISAKTLDAAWVDVTNQAIALGERMQGVLLGMVVKQADKPRFYRGDGIDRAD